MVLGSSFIQAERSILGNSKMGTKTVREKYFGLPGMNTVDHLKMAMPRGWEFVLLMVKRGVVTLNWENY